MDKRSNINKSVLFVALITSFITTFMGSALNLSIPTIAKEFNADSNTVGWIVTSYMLTCAVFAIPFGRLGDLFNRKSILWSGLLVFSLASVTCVFASRIIYLIALRSIQGIGTAMIFSSNIALLVDNTDEESKGKVLGLATAANYGGLSAGPVLGGFINYYLGWKSIFLAAALVSAVAFLAVYFKTPVSSSIKKHSDFKIKELFYNKSFVYSNIAALINYGATFAISYLLSMYLQDVKGYTSRDAGLILVCAPAIQTVVSPLAGKLSDKFSPYKLSALGMTISAISMILFATFGKNTDLIVVILVLALGGLGVGIFSSPNTNAVMSSVEKNSYGLASSVLSTMRSLGHTFSTSLIMAIGHMQSCFIIFGIGCIIGIFMALKGKT